MKLVNEYIMYWKQQSIIFCFNFFHEKAQKRCRTKTSRVKNFIQRKFLTRISYPISYKRAENKNIRFFQLKRKKRNTLYAVPQTFNDREKIIQNHTDDFKAETFEKCIQYKIYNLIAYRTFPRIIINVYISDSFARLFAYRKMRYRVLSIDFQWRRCIFRFLRRRKVSRRKMDRFSGIGVSRRSHVRRKLSGTRRARYKIVTMCVMQQDMLYNIIHFWTTRKLPYTL